MNCMKCGRKIKDNQVFCEECLGIMDAYPVKPGTPIQLPTPSNSNLGVKPSSRRKQKKPEEQILSMRITIRRLTLALILTFLALLVAVGVIFLLTRGTELSLMATQFQQFG